MENLTLETTQHVNLNYRMASIGERILAFIIDMTIMGAAATLGIIGLTKAGLSNGAAAATILVPLAFYHLIFEVVYHGQTPGMMFLKIKVIAENGGQVPFMSYLLRWLLRLVEIWITSGVLAIIFIMISKKGQRIGDIAAGTSMVSTRMKPVFDPGLFTKVPDDYEPIFLQAADLSMQEIKTLYEVLKFYTEFPEKHEAILMVYTAQKNLKTRWNIETDMRPAAFIETVVKDYNALNRKVTV